MNLLQTKTIRKIYRFFSDKTGLTILPNRLYASRTLQYEWDRLKEILERFYSLSLSLCIFDVGAHQGETIERYQGWFPQAKIISFEPDPNSVQIMKGRYPNNSIYQIALSNSRGKMPFYRCESSVMSSLEIPNPSLIRTVEKIDVEVMRGDDFVKAENIPNIDILKINVQGHDAKVLEGFQESLQRGAIKIIIVELDLVERYSTKVEFRDVENVIAPHGYGLWDIILLRRTPVHQRISHMHVVYVHRSLSNGKFQ